MTCPFCSEETPANRNSCQACKHLLKRVVPRFRWVGGAPSNSKLEMFWTTGEPSVFARPGAPDYNPRWDV